MTALRRHRDRRGASHAHLWVDLRLLAWAPSRTSISRMCQGRAPELEADEEADAREDAAFVREVFDIVPRRRVSAAKSETVTVWFPCCCRPVHRYDMGPTLRCRSTGQSIPSHAYGSPLGGPRSCQMHRRLGVDGVRPHPCQQRRPPPFRQVPPVIPQRRAVSSRGPPKLRHGTPPPDRHSSHDERHLAAAWLVGSSPDREGGVSSMKVRR